MRFDVTTISESLIVNASLTAGVNQRWGVNTQERPRTPREVAGDPPFERPYQAHLKMQSPITWGQMFFLPRRFLTFEEEKEGNKINKQSMLIIMMMMMIRSVDLKGVSN